MKRPLITIIAVAIVAAAQSRLPQPGTQDTPNNPWADASYYPAPGNVEDLTGYFCAVDPDDPAGPCLYPLAGCTGTWVAYTTANSGIHNHEAVGGRLVTPGRPGPKILNYGGVTAGIPSAGFSGADGSIVSRWALPIIAGWYTWEVANPRCPNPRSGAPQPTNSIGLNVFAAWKLYDYFAEEGGQNNRPALVGVDQEHGGYPYWIELQTAASIQAGSAKYHLRTRTQRLYLVGTQPQSDDLLIWRMSHGARQGQGDIGVGGGPLDNITSPADTLSYAPSSQYTTNRWIGFQQEQHPIGHDVDIANPIFLGMPTLNFFAMVDAMDASGCTLGGYQVNSVNDSTRLIGKNAKQQYWLFQPNVHFNCAIVQYVYQ